MAPTLDPAAAPPPVDPDRAFGRALGGMKRVRSRRVSLCAIEREWTRTDISYGARIAHLNGSVSGGLNAGRLLTTGADRTVFDDTDVDRLTGGLGLDWFLLNRTGGSALDRYDAETTETSADL